MDESGRENGQRSAATGVASCGKEAAWYLECADGDAAGTGSTTAIVHVAIVCAGEAGDRVHQQENIFACFDEALGTLDGQLGDAAVIAWLFVIGTCVNFCAGEGAAEFGHLFRALIDQDDHQMDGFLIFFSNGLGHVQEKCGFAGSGRRDDQATLAATDGCHDIDDARGEALGSGLEADAFGGVDRFEFVEMRKF